MGNLINGPFKTEREARAAAHQIVRTESGWLILQKSQNLVVLEQACEAAGVELGVYDRRILDWLAGFEDSICGVVAGLVARAHAAGKPGPHAVVFDMADSQDTQFALTEALEMFVFEHREIASLRGRSSARERWADRAEAMRDQAEAAADVPSEPEPAVPALVLEALRRRHRAAPVRARSHPDRRTRLRLRLGLRDRVRRRPALGRDDHHDPRID